MVLCLIVLELWGKKIKMTRRIHHLCILHISYLKCLKSGLTILLYSVGRK